MIEIKDVEEVTTIKKTIKKAGVFLSEEELTCLIKLGCSGLVRLGKMDLSVVEEERMVTMLKVARIKLENARGRAVTAAVPTTGPTPRSCTGTAHTHNPGLSCNICL